MNSRDNLNKVKELNQALKEAIDIILKQKSIIQSQRKQLLESSLTSWLVYEDVFEKNGISGDFPQLLVNAKDLDFNVNRKLKLFAENIILIVSEDKKRKKVIYLYDEKQKPELRFSRFLINDQDLTFPKLLNGLDPLSRILFRVSKEEIVNITFFEELSKSTIKPLIKHTGMLSIKSIEVSIKAGMNNFRKLKDIYAANVLSHKKLFSYKSAIEVELDGKFEELKNKITMKTKKAKALKSPKGNSGSGNPNWPSTTGNPSGGGRGNGK